MNPDKVNMAFTEMFSLQLSVDSLQLTAYSGSTLSCVL